MQSKYKFPKGRGYALFLILATVMFILFGSSCKKFIMVVPPTNAVTAATVYNDNKTATSVLTGIYSNMSANGFESPGLSGMAFFTGLSSDELTMFNNVNVSQPTDYAYYENLLSAGGSAGVGSYGGESWFAIYPVIYTANAAMEGLTNSTGLTPAIKQQLLGEAKFMRAFCYFYLVNLYGDVPLATTTNYKANALLPRAPKDTAWQLIISDLKDAQSRLNSNFLDASLLNATTQRLRPTKWAADALLARAYLYIGDWTDAENQADSVINNTALFSLDTLNGVFLVNSTEAIWQLQGLSSYSNVSEAQNLVLPSVGPNGFNFVYLNKNLVNSFEPGDQRKVNWVDSIVVPDTVSYYGVNYYGGGIYYYAYKYKNISFSANNTQTEYLTVLRLAELYLIRAEARARQGNIAGAQADINMIRNRAGLANTTASDQPSLLAAITHERQDELFLEWGDRWLDLKRTKAIDSVMSMVCPQKGGTWNTNQQLYPIPASEIQADPKLVQNAGY